MIFVKEQSKRFVIVDAAMNDLIRPAIYKEYHHVVPLTDHKGAPRSPADVEGHSCETGDWHALGRRRRKRERGG